ncbi:MAG: AraC family transcriptional regulator, partial [Gillisia sp.]
YYIEAGEGFISGATKKLHLKPGHLYLIPSFTLCNLKCENYLSQYFIQFFEESPDGNSLFRINREPMEIKAKDLDIILFKRLLKINPGRGINRSDNPEVYEKEKFYKEYRSLNKRMNTSNRFETQGSILILLSRFMKLIKLEPKETDQIPSVILDAIHYIQLNLGNSITVGDLAAHANQNRDYFSRQFLKHTGQRPLGYIHEKRVERAQYLMVTTSKTLLDIAIETGFNNLQHFSKIFKQVVKIPPGAYRKQSNRLTSYNS